MAVVLVALGLALVVVSVLDVVWTAAAAGSGAGPLSGRLSALLWRLGLAVGRGRDGPRDRWAWTGGGLGGLDQHLVALTPMVHGLAERHVTYPVLQYFHSARHRTSTALGLAVLDDALAVLRKGVAAEVRPEAVVVEPLAQAVGWYLDTIEDAFVSGAPGPLPPPDLDGLRRAGIPTVADDEFRSALEDEGRRRCQLAKLLVDDGWLLDAWERRRREVPEAPADLGAVTFCVGAGVSRPARSCRPCGLPPRTSGRRRPRR